MMRGLLVLTLAMAPHLAAAAVFDASPAAMKHPREAMQHAWLVRVKPGGNARYYWLDGRKGCPALTDACKRRGYLVPGDVAVAAYVIGAFTLVEFIGPTGQQTEGAIETRLLETVEQSKPEPNDWVGHWQDTDEQYIVIALTSDAATLGFVGQALWGSHDPERVKIGAVNQGEFGAYVRPTGEWGGFVVALGDAGEPGYRLPAIAQQGGIDTDWSQYFPAEASYAEDGRCRASFRLLGPYLLAYTPMYVCGGMNVTFTGVYRRVAEVRK